MSEPTMPDERPTETVTPAEPGTGTSSGADAPSSAEAPPTVGTPSPTGDAPPPDVPIPDDAAEERLADGPPRPAPPTSESVATGVTDLAGLSASEAAARKRAETAAAVAMVAAVAKARAEQTAQTAALEAPVEETAPARPSRLKALRGFVLMLLRGAVAIGLFVFGLSLGNLIYQANAPTSPALVVDPSTQGAEPPAVVQEFIGALSAGDTDALRSSLQAEPHARLTSEFKRFGIQQITGVETLSTHVDDDRTATEIVMLGKTTDGTPISINLVVLTNGNTIEGFR